jgi:hypothetical protein
MMTIWGIPVGVQLDVGNALVGIGTILLAFVTFFITYANIRETRRIALRSSTAEAHQQLSNRRLLWSDALRDEIAELVALGANFDSHDEARCDRLNKYVTTISLRLRSDREDHEVLLDILRDLSDFIKVSPTSSDEEREIKRRQFINKLNEVPPAAKMVLQNEWEIIKAEINMEKGV